MNDRRVLVVTYDPDLERRTVRCWTDEHGHGRIVGLECSPVVS